MTTWDLIIALFYHVDEQLHALPKHPEAHLWPSEVVTLGLLHCSVAPAYPGPTPGPGALAPGLPLARKAKPWSTGVFRVSAACCRWTRR